MKVSVCGGVCVERDGEQVFPVFLYLDNNVADTQQAPGPLELEEGSQSLQQPHLRTYTDGQEKPGFENV